MSATITLSSVVIKKLVPISYLGTGSDYCEIEFEVPAAEETDCTALLNTGTDSGWINAVRNITWDGGSAIPLKCVSLIKAYNGTAKCWRIRCQSNSPVGATVWPYIGAMLVDYGPGTARTLTVAQP